MLDEDDVMENEVEATVKGGVDPQDAFRAMQAADPRLSGATAVRTADPMVLVRELVASVPQSVGAASVSEPARAAGRWGVPTLALLTMPCQNVRQQSQSESQVWRQEDRGPAE